MVLIVDVVRDRKIMQIYTVLKIEANGNLSFLFSKEKFCQGNVSSLSFAIRYRLISDLTRITYAAISLSLHTSRQAKWSRNCCLLLQQCKHSRFLLHRLFQLWSQVFVEVPKHFRFTMRLDLVHAIKAGLRSIKPDNLFDDSAFRRRLPLLQFAHKTSSCLACENEFQLKQKLKRRNTFPFQALAYAL